MCVFEGENVKVSACDVYHFMMSDVIFVLCPLCALFETWYLLASYPVCLKVCVCLEMRQFVLYP